MALLSLNNLHTYYGRVHTLKGITMSVEEGDIVTLIGANGAGKSTTLRTISGLVRPREGTITFQGQRLGNIPAHLIVEMGVSHAPEGRKIFSTLTVQGNLTRVRTARLEPGADLRQSGTGVRAVPAHQGATQTERRDAVRRRTQMLCIGRA